MDEQYAHQLADLMLWSPVFVRVPSPDAAPPPSASPSPALQTAQSAPRPNNPGYLFYTFPSATDAASVLAQLHSANAAQSRAGLDPVRLPNSERIMDLGYASTADSLECWKLYNSQQGGGRSDSTEVAPTSVVGESSLTVDEDSTTTQSMDGIPTRTLDSSSGAQSISKPSNDTNANHPLPSPQTSTPAHQSRATGGEYSIFVGDLAPDVTHADIVAVFRDPTKGLRPDRGPPRKIKPFTSCKMAKIMVDQTTGLSRGYGFIRFSDEADQRRALIEMQGLYCLSRPSKRTRLLIRNNVRSTWNPLLIAPFLRSAIISCYR